MSHTSPLGEGHTANVGASTSAAWPTLTVRVVPELATLAVHTNTAKLAVPPGGTLLLRYGKTDTHSWAGGGGGLVLLGVGVGVGVGVAVGVAVGVGVVEVVGSVDGVVVGDGLEGLEVLGDGDGLVVDESLGLDDGVALAVRLGVLVPDGLALGPVLEGLVLEGLVLEGLVLEVRVVGLAEADWLDVGLLICADVVAVLACAEIRLAVAVGRAAHGLAALSRMSGPWRVSLAPAPMITTASTISPPSAAVWARLSISSARSCPAR
jgi:hypothetical protein